jgi:hypothetical protein
LTAGFGGDTITDTYYRYPKGAVMAKKQRDRNLEQQIMAARRAERAERVAALADGRKQRAATFADRKRVANKKACRDRSYWS